MPERLLKLVYGEFDRHAGSGNESVCWVDNPSHVEFRWPHWGEIDNARNGFQQIMAGKSFYVYDVNEIDSALNLLRNQISQLTSKVEADERAVQDLRAELLKRFQDLPVELVQNEEAYQLLQVRLKNDLSQVFRHRDHRPEEE